MNPSRPMLVLLWLTAAVLACAPPHREPEPPRLQPASATLKIEPAKSERERRVDQLAARLDKARVEEHVPGMAVAVVADDEVIFARGFGYADIDADEKVTPETVFAIGSSTKAFTSALVGTLVDEGELGWDDPIEKWVPELKLAVKGTDRRPTLRDAMSHRTGFTRMGMIWAANGVTRPEMFATATHAQPWADYGKTFLYNNVVYASAGEAAARAGGEPWATLIAERFLLPLGMDSSSTTIDAMAQQPKHAQGYRYDDAEHRFEEVPMRNLDLIAPAGAINSTVLDMTKWLRLQLGRGEIDGKRIVSAESLETTWTPQIDVGAGMKYGLGWFVSDWKGHRVVEHGGNIDGYAAEVAMLPDDGIGFVLLSNVPVSPLQTTSREIVWSSLLGPLDLPEESEKTPKVETEPYVGKYVADFGPWDDERMEVIAEGGALWLDVPQQTRYELQPPDGAGRWKFAMAPQVAASFEHVEDGKAMVLRLHQGGIDFEMPREGWMPEPDVDLAAHRGYLGQYASDKGKGKGKGSATVLVQNNRLAVDIPGQMIYELSPPDDDGQWHFRVKKDISVEFEKGTGKARDDVVALVIHQSGTDARMDRKGPPPKLPTVAELAKLRRSAKREAAIGKLGLVEIDGTIAYEQSGVEGKVRIVCDGQRVRSEIDLGKFGTITAVDNGTRAWSEGTLSPPEELHGRYLEQNKEDHPLALARALSTVWPSVEITGEVEVEGKTRLRATLRRGKLPVVQVLIDPAEGDVVQTRGRGLVPGIGSIPIKTQLSDYRPELGLRLAHEIEREDTPSGRTVITVTGVKRFAGDAAALFPAGPPSP